MAEPQFILAVSAEGLQEINKLQKEVNKVIRSMEKYQGISRLGIQLNDQQIQDYKDLQEQFEGLGGDISQLSKFTGKKPLIADPGSIQATQEKVNDLVYKMRQYQSVVQMGIPLSQQQKQDYKDLQNEFEGMGGKLKNLETGTKRSILGAAKWGLAWTLVYGVIRSITGAFKEAINTLMILDDALARVATVTTPVSESFEQAMDRMRDAVLDYSYKSRAAMKDTATALYHLGSAGLNSQEQLAGLQPIMDLQIGTLGTLEESARLVTGAYNLFKNSLSSTMTIAEKFRYISDIVTYTFRAQEVELSEIASAFGYVGTAVGALDVDFETLTATIGFLNTGLLRGSRSGTSLMQSFSQLAQNSDKLAKYFHITFDPNEPINFIEIMTQLHEKIGEVRSLTAEESDALREIFGQRGVRAIRQILIRWDDWVKAIDEVKTKSKDMSITLNDIMQKTLPGAIATLANQIRVDLADAMKKPVASVKELIGHWVEARIKAREYYKEIEFYNQKLKPEKPQPLPLQPQTWQEMILGPLGPALRIGAEKIGTWLGKSYDIAVEKQRQYLSGLMGIEKATDAMIQAFGELIYGGMSIDEAIKKIKELNQEYTNTVEITNILTGNAEQYEEYMRRIKPLKDVEGRRVILQTLEREHQYEMMKIAGYRESIILQQKMADYLRLNGKYASEQIDYIKMYHEYVQNVAKDYWEIVDVLSTGISDTIWDIVQGTEDWTESLGDAADKIAKMTLEKAVKEIIINPIFDMSTMKMQLAVSEFGRWVTNFQNAVNQLSTGQQASAAGNIFPFPLPSAGKTDQQQQAQIRTMQQISASIQSASTLYSAYQGGSPLGGAMMGAMSGMSIGTMLGGPPGAAVGLVMGGIAGGIAGLLGKGAKKTPSPEIRTTERLINVESQLKITNRTLEIINRNIVGIRRNTEGYIMPESFYLRQRRSNTLADNFAIGMSRGYA